MRTPTPAMKRGRTRDGGAVLVVVLLIMLIMLGLGMTALWLTSGNLQVASNMNQRTHALYCAEAGLERARALLNGPTAPDLNALLRGAGRGQDNVPTGIDATTKQPNGIGAILMEGATALEAIDFPPASFARLPGSTDTPAAIRMGRYTVWIRNDLGEIRGGRPITDTNNTVTIRSQGVGLDGVTNVVLETTMAAAGTPATSTARPGSNCYAGKNVCDDGSSTQYGLMISLGGGER